MNEALLMAWRTWDFLYYHCTRLHYVDKENNNIFRIVVKKYRGNPLTIGEETIVAPGDYYVKLHIHNYQLAYCLRGKTGDLRLGLLALKQVKTSLPALARAVAAHPYADRIKGVVGTTILHQGAERLGFRVQAIDTAIFRVFKTVFFKWILCLCHPEGIKRVRRHSRKKMTAKRVFMSKEQLLRAYQGD